MKSAAAWLVAACLTLPMAGPASGQGLLDAARWPFPHIAGEFHYLADVDLDGDEDLLLFHGTPGTPTVWEAFSVRFNDGSGELTVAGPQVSLLGTNRLEPIGQFGVRRLGDLTGDGLPDVVLLERTPTFDNVRLQVWPLTASGSAGAPLDIPLTGDLRAATLGDVDADGTDELAVVDHVVNDLRITWFNFNGTGFSSFSSHTVIQVFGAPSAARIVALDVDGDADLDLVWGDWQGLELHVMRLGQNGLEAPVDVPVGLTVANHYPFVADLVGGGAQDLLVVGVGTSSSDFSLTPVLNDLSGVLQVGVRQTLDTWDPVFGNGFDVVDWDGDGDMDVTVYPLEEPGGTTEGIAAVYENLGDDSFGAEPSARMELIYAGYWGPGIADLNGDGLPDYVGAQTCYLGDGAFSDSLPELTDFFFGSTPVALPDREGDGDADLFFQAGSSRPNDATGAFGAGQAIPAPPAGLQWKPVAAIGDFTGDGRPDFLVGLEQPGTLPFFIPTFIEMRLLADDGQGAYVDLGVPGTGAGSIEPSGRTTTIAVDFDLDGDLDVFDRFVTQTGLWFNDGSGNLSPLPDLFPGEAVAVGDVDADGDLDVINQSGASTLQLMRHDGAFGFTAEPLHTALSQTEWDSPRLLDLDGDGDLDLALALTAGGEAVVLYENDGAGNFSFAATLSTNIVSGMIDFEFVHVGADDLDGDGILDLVVGPQAASGSIPNKLAVFQGLGGGFAYAPVRFYTGGPIGGFADVDADGDLDAVGRVLVRARRFHGPQDGSLRQYGAGTAGTGGFQPVLGASGPMRPDSDSAALRLTGAVGGGWAYILYGFAEGQLPGVPFPGATFAISGPHQLVGVPVGGAPGAPGAGSFEVGLPPSILAVAAGFTVYLQVAVHDTGVPPWLAMSQGLEITFGQ